MSAREWLGRARQFQSIVLLLAAALMGASGSARAQYTEILILDQEYSTTYSITDHDPDCFSPSRCPPGTITTTTTQQTNSTTPLATELDVQRWRAKGTADAFSVSTDAYGWAHATAETELTFQVLQDSDVLLTFAGSVNTWSWGSFSLFDETTGADVYATTFGRGAGVGTPLDGSGTFSGSLDSSHIYQLNLRGDADDQYEGGWRMSLSVSGLSIAAPVPEPSTLAMMLAGLGAVGFAARRRKSAWTGSAD